MYEDTKEALVSVEDRQFVALQAKAQLLESLRKRLVQPSFAEMQAPYTTKE